MNFKRLLTFAAIPALLWLSAACSKDDHNDGSPTKGPTTEYEGSVLKGDITGSVSLSANTTYTLRGACLIKDGGKLYIPAGTIIKAEEGFANYMLVERGGQIFINGTAANPVVFTANSDSPYAGFWGGLIINGKAPISGVNQSGNEGSTEIAKDIKYGGNDEADNSGTITYVKLLYTGAQSSDNVEHNGLTLDAVGSGTKIENVYVYKSADDAIEFFGGSVNVTNIMSVDCDDDMFDFTQGYTGTLSNAYGIWTGDFSSTEKDPRGIEADGNLDGENPNAYDQSNFTVKNVTFDFTSSSSTIEDVIKIRRGARTKVENARLLGTSVAKNIIDVTDGEGNADHETSIDLDMHSFKGTCLYDIINNGGDSGFANLSVSSTSNSGANVSAFAWAKPVEVSDGSDASEYEGTALHGEITTPVKLNASKTYTLDGTMLIKDGGKLYIPAGTVIKARDGFDKYLLVERGGQIFAQGTAEKPVIFTSASDDPQPGIWGGLIINGKAPISGVNQSGNEGSTEIAKDILYGGTASGDCSGILTYVELLYTGAQSSDNVEHNGLTLDAVGSGTVINNIFVYKSADDAIEFFGGSVNVDKILSVDCDDDMFDFTQGYTGTLSNAYGIWTSSFLSSEKDPRGIEADGNLDGENPNAYAQSDFKVKNVTFDFYSSQDKQVEDVVKIRRGAKVAITNALAEGFSSFKDFVDMTDGEGNGDTASSINITNKMTGAMTGSLINPSSGYNGITIADGNTGCDFTLFSWTGYNYKK
ncbi:MAG: hypothetical protein LKI53_05875 [Bacteroidales bacterium]|jgi:hypothetical protein|nr:hypothetical protein [Bacteroidales bacterium]